MELNGEEETENERKKRRQKSVRVKERVKEKGREQDGDRGGWRERETERRGTHKGIKVLHSGFEESSIDSTRLDMTLHHLKWRREERRGEGNS